MKPLYRTLLVIGIAMGVVATSLIFGVGQVMVMHMQERSGYDSDVYILHHGSGNTIYGMPLDLAREIRGWLPEDITASVISSDAHDAVVRIDAEVWDADVIGVDADFPAVFGMDLTNGRFFTKEEQENRRRVCVVTSDLMALFGEDALELLTVNGIEYKVIGTVQGDAGTARTPFGNYSSNTIFFPIEVWYEDFYQGEFRHRLIMQLAVHSPGYSKADLARFVSHNLIHMEDAPAIKVSAPNEIGYSSWVQDLLILTGIFFVAFIVFLLAGLNIIQIASANVYDQQRVFGLKVALGALPRHLAGEITGEITACALQGGYLGIVLAGIVNTVMNQRVGQYWAAFNVFTAIAGMLLSLLVGWITAIIPARQAAKIDPVLVLREER